MFSCGMVDTKANDLLLLFYFYGKKCQVPVGSGRYQGGCQERSVLVTVLPDDASYTTSKLANFDELFDIQIFSSRTRIDETNHRIYYVENVPAERYPWFWIKV